ncbi:MAG: methyltransferase domain-containing protein [Eubacteriales bacterium]|nr:methyltransferase domain-containing protein [Eubacteriales bacterium]
MDYKQIINVCEESKYLISMVPVERVIEFGWQIGLNDSTSMLDFCCGYGEMLKLWSEAFNITGIGIDRENSFIEAGTLRLKSDRIKLVTGDIFKHNFEEKYDVVVCTELSSGSPGHRLFESFADGITFLEQFVKSKGKLVFGRLFSKQPNPPQELIDFDGDLPTLDKIYTEIKQCGYYITAMVSDTSAQWERYIMWSAKRDLERLRQNPNDEYTAAWLDKWYRIYFEHRRQYEGWGMFAIEKL